MTNASKGSENPEAKKGRGQKCLPAELSRVNLNAAGIDVGASSHFVAVPEGRWEQPGREFEAFTADLCRLADWLTECGVETVAMESTGVYWIPLTKLSLKALRSLNSRLRFVFCSGMGRRPARKSVTRLPALGAFQPKSLILMQLGRYVSSGWRASVAAASFLSVKPDLLRESCKFPLLSNRLLPACFWPRKRYSTC